MSGKRHFSCEQVDAIAKAAGGIKSDIVDLETYAGTGQLTVQKVPRQTALHHRLELAAAHYVLQASLEIRPTPIQLIRAYTKIENASKRLLEALYLNESNGVGDIPAALRNGGLLPHAAREADSLGGFPLYTSEGLLRSSVEGIQRLLRWSVIAAARERQKSARRNDKGNKGEVAIKQLFQDLLGIWSDIFERDVQVGGGGDKAGPLIWFVRVSAEPVLGRRKLTNEAIRDRLRRMIGSKGTSRSKKR